MMHLNLTFAVLWILSTSTDIHTSDRVRGDYSKQHQRQKRSELQYCSLRSEPQCCLGSPCCSPPNGGGCCCDEACHLVFDDCCPDYFDTCHSDSLDLPNGTSNGYNSTNNETATLTACQQTESSSCALVLEINITKCSGGFNVYKLKSTPTNSAYCFGSGLVKCENGTSSESGYYPGCSSSFPPEIITPTVKPRLVEGESYSIGPYPRTPSLHTAFVCEFDEITNKSYAYDIYWYINGNHLKNHTNVPYIDINSTQLVTTDWVGKYQLNMEVACSIRLRSLPGSLPSPHYTSKIYNAGIFPEKYEYTVHENEHIIIPIRSTVLVACFSSHEVLMNQCEQNFYIFQPNYHESSQRCVNNLNPIDVIFNAEFCGFKFGDKDWNQTKNLEVYGYSDGKYNSYHRVTYIKISTHSLAPFGGDIWENLNVPDIKVTVLDKDAVMTGRMCQSSNDPHITTFDGIHYHYMEVGEFVLYRNNKGPYWVHALFTNCGFGWTGSSCHCGIAVRSKRSLFVLRTCSRVSRTEKYLLSQPHTEVRTCDDNDILVVNKGNRYTMTLPIWTEIQFSVSLYSMFISSITIKPSVHDIGVARGLCGVPSPTKDASDDFTSRLTDSVVSEKSFADSWKIDRETMPDEQLFIADPIFLSEDIKEPYSNITTDKNQTLPRFCVCEKKAGQTDDLDFFYTLQCNLTEPAQLCSSALQTTKQSFVTSCSKSISGREKRSAHHRIVRRSVDNSDDVIDFVPLEFHDETSEKNATLKDPEFRNGWTEEKANNTCEEQIKALVPTDLVSEVSGSGNDEYIKFSIQSCILDIKLMADTTYIQDTVGAMQTLTLMEASRNVTLTELQSDDGSKTMLEYITSLMCNCSGNGNCSTDGLCLCHNGFIGDDCSTSTTIPPTVGSLPENGLCKTNIRACLTTNVFGIFQSPDIWCKRQHFKIVNNSIELSGTSYIIKAEYRNPNMVSVSLATSRRKRSKIEIRSPEGFDLSFSYDGVNFGNTTSIIIYDEECYSCTKDPVVCVVLSTCPALTTVEISTELTTLPSTVQETDTATTLETDSTTLNDESTVIDTTMGVSQPEQLEGLIVVSCVAFLLLLASIVTCICFKTMPKTRKFKENNFATNVDSWIYKGKHDGPPKALFFKPAIRANLSKRQKY